MKKIYTIRITGCSKPNIWYAGKKGQEFEAELRASGYDHRAVISFLVNPCQFVHLIDCMVIGERIVEPYIKKDA